MLRFLSCDFFPFGVVGSTFFFFFNIYTTERFRFLVSASVSCCHFLLLLRTYGVMLHLGLHCELLI